MSAKGAIAKQLVASALNSRLTARNQKPSPTKKLINESFKGLAVTTGAAVGYSMPSRKKPGRNSHFELSRGTPGNEESDP